MKIVFKLVTILFAITIYSCGEEESIEKEKESIKLKTPKSEKKIQTNQFKKASDVIDLTNKGIGPINALTLPSNIDLEMVAEGEAIFKRLCSACHRVGKKFIGPDVKGILNKRTPEWVMNIIIDPEGMVKKDPLAISLLKEYNGSPMVNQNLTEKQARAILEYIRSLK